MKNHYEWLNKNLPQFFKAIKIDFDRFEGLLSAHGDKCYGYQNYWEKHQIPFEHGVAIFLVSYFKPYYDEVGDTKDGWVDVKEWVVSKYSIWKTFLK